MEFLIFIILLLTVPFAVHMYLAATFHVHMHPIHVMILHNRVIRSSVVAIPRS